MYSPDVYPTATVYTTSASQLSIATSTATSTDGSFTLTLTGSYPVNYPIEAFSCNGTYCYENLYGLEVSTNGGVSWDVVSNSMDIGFWDTNLQRSFTGVADGSYLYRAVERYYDEDTSYLYDEVYYSPTQLQIDVQGQ